jgi:HEAT repeat protein
MSIPNPYRAVGTFVGEAYVEREADRRLRAAIEANQRYPYMLAPRQSGKSSLIAHTRTALSPADYRSVLIDLSTFSPHALADYDEFLHQVFAGWLADLGFRESFVLEYGRFTSGLEILLTLAPRRLVLFIDEIDVLLGSPFKDSFLSVIRNVFNQRVDLTDYVRAQFVLAGATRPEQLISDTQRSPFNVGEPIELTDLTPAEVQQISCHASGVGAAVHPGVAATIHRHTGGSVYLTQLVLERLWEDAVSRRPSEVSVADVVRVVDAIVAGSSRDVHFTNIYNMVVADQRARQILARLLQQEPVNDLDRGYMAHTGLYGPPGPFRNGIYARVFGTGGPLDVMGEVGGRAAQLQLAREREAYLEAAVATFGSYDLALDLDLRLSLERMFVPLWAELIPSPVGDESGRPWGLGKKRDGAPARARLNGAELPRGLPTTRAVILGGPGTGKTTLLRYLALRQASERSSTEGQGRLLPVYLRLAEYAYGGGADVGLISYCTSTSHSGLSLPSSLLAAEATAGRCLFLLDGFDEVPLPDRLRVRDQIIRLARAYPGCPILVTARPPGYRVAPFPAGPNGFVFLSLVPLEASQVSRFIQLWSEEIRLPGGPTASAGFVRTALEELLGNHLALQALAISPLLMALLLHLIHRTGRVPTQRSSAIRAAADLLLDRWPQSRTPEVFIPQGVVTSLLMTIAFNIQAGSSSLIGRSQVEAVLREQVQESLALHTAEALSAADYVLRFMEETSGLLVEEETNQEGEKMYRFVHIAFQEHFAARELARLWQRGQVRLAGIVREPSWQEVVLLAGAELSVSGDESAASRFVDEVFRAGSPYEEQCHHDLLLAARCLAEGAYAVPALRKEIFDRLDRVFSTSIAPLNEQLANALSLMTGRTVVGDAFLLLVRKLSHEHASVRRAAVQALGRLAATSPSRSDILPDLVDRLDDSEAAVREAAVRALAALWEAVADPTLTVRLLQRLADSDMAVRRAAAEVFDLLDKRTQQELLAALLQPRDSPEWYARRVAASRLGESDAARSGLAAALLRQFADDEDFVREAVLLAGPYLPESSRREVVIMLRERIARGEASDRRAAAEALGSLGPRAGPEAGAVLVHGGTDRLKVTHPGAN